MRAQVSKARELRTPAKLMRSLEISRVAWPSSLDFHFHCESCGQVENRIELGKLVGRKVVKSMIALAIAAHVERHAA